MKDVNNPLIVLDIVVRASLGGAQEAAKAVELNVSTAPFRHAIEEIISTRHYRVEG